LGHLRAETVVDPVRWLKFAIGARWYQRCSTKCMLECDELELMQLAVHDE